MRTIKSTLLLPLFALLTVGCSRSAQNVSIIAQSDNNRVQFAVEYLTERLTASGYTITDTNADHTITIGIADRPIESAGKEGFRITTSGNATLIEGTDGSGTIYGAVELAEQSSHTNRIPDCNLTDQPEMVLRGSCIGLQKPYYLPGHTVYEYPYTPETFDWFYDRERWIDYLDMLVENRMNSLYLWNGHPFASLVRLDDYPFAVEVDDDTFRKNEEMFAFLTREADRRGIFVIQMFYNIIVSKPFAEHYGIKTQDRNRPITPLLSDYTRKSVAAFIEKYPNVGLLVCLGEAMATVEDDVEWFTKTIIPGVKDGLSALGKTEEPPLLLRAHDTDCQKVMEAALPLYKNLYTMHKYNGESLTTYTPRGPWSEIHRQLSSLGSVHIENVHILANLEPFRWGSPDFIEKAVVAMHEVHGANALHLYPQASYWDYPYTADLTVDSTRLNEIDRDWIWYAAWGRYAWRAKRDSVEEHSYWCGRLSDYYGVGNSDAAAILEAYEQSGEIAPKLLRRFGITEGNRQTLLLGMTVSELINPYKYTVYPGFYESCGPEGEKLIEYVEREWRGEPHKGELPLEVTNDCVDRGERAAKSVASVKHATRHRDELERLKGDMEAMRLFAHYFERRVEAARMVLEYQWSNDLEKLHQAAPPLKESVDYYEQLAQLTEKTYLYANSMQTQQRRIPVGGDGGKMKHWSELLPVYRTEYDNMIRNTVLIDSAATVKGNSQIEPLEDADVKLYNRFEKIGLHRGEQLYADYNSTIDSVATELSRLSAYRLSRSMCEKGITIEFESADSVNLLVGYFRDDNKRFAKAPTLETDASANDYGQAEPVLQNALLTEQMPMVNVHCYRLGAGHHTLTMPKKMYLLLGFTADRIESRNVFVGAGDNQSVDWIFY